jgi:hypothetical protein
MKSRSYLANDAMESALRLSGLVDDAPNNAVDALIQQTLGEKAALLGRGRKKRPAHDSPNPAERKAAEDNERHSRSLAQIAKIIGCEGFTEFCAMGTLHFARTRLWGKQYGDDVDETRRNLGLLAGKLPPELSMAIGKLIHLQCAASFNAGLRIGLMSSLWALALLSERRDTQ